LITKLDSDFIEIFKHFHRTAGKLRESRLLKEKFTIGFTLTLSQSGPQVTVKQPDETDLKAYLTTFRQFIMQKEPTYMGDIYTLLQLHLKDEKLKGYLAKSQDFWQNAHERASIGMIYNKKQVSPQEISKLFLYGDIFHGDLEKEKAIDSLLPHEHGLFKSQFLEYILRATDQILYVDRIIGKALGENLFV
jgi:hypothetical protein